MLAHNTHNYKMLYIIIHCYRQKGPEAWAWRILALGAFPFTSVAVAWFSWPHLIGTEVFYIMAGIGYEHSDFEKFKLITEKAELSGNPIVSRFPDNFQDLTEVTLELHEYTLSVAYKHGMHHCDLFLPTGM